MNTQENTIENQASYYLQQIKKNNIKELYFFPLKKNSGADSNKFRLAVLQYLTACPFLYRAKNLSERLEIATKSAIKAGYIINEVYADDYDRKIYLKAVKCEASKNNLDLIAA